MPMMYTRTMHVEYPSPILTVDVALFTLMAGQLHVLLMQRDQEPYTGVLALPGAYVHPAEDIDCASAAHRVTRQKLGLDVAYLEQLRTFSGMDRDPRGWSASVAHIAVIKADQVPVASAREFYPVDNLPILGFDHNEIVLEAVNRLRNKTNYSSLPLFLMPEKFTINELRLVYEELMGIEINRNNFRRLMMEQQLVVPTGEMQSTREDGVALGHRPAELFRASDDTLAIFRAIH